MKKNYIAPYAQIIVVETSSIMIPVSGSTQGNEDALGNEGSMWGDTWGDDYGEEEE